MSVVCKEDEEQRRQSHCIKHIHNTHTHTYIYTRAAVARICKVASRQKETEGETRGLLLRGKGAMTKLEERDGRQLEWPFADADVCWIVILVK